MKPSPSWGLALCGLLACGTEPPTPNPPTDAGLAADVVDVQLVTDAPPALDLVAADAGVDVLEDRAEVAAADVPQDAPADVRVIPDGACVAGRVQVWPDLDGDGWGNRAVPMRVLCDHVQPSHVFRGGDCDDTRPEVNPDVSETCRNGRDDDCDDHIDEGC